MASLVITAKASAFKGRQPRALTSFKDEDERSFVAMPTMPPAKEGKEAKIKWTVPDTAKNRERFRKNYEPSGVYSCKTIDQTTPEAFVSEPSKAENPTA